MPIAVGDNYWEMDEVVVPFKLPTSVVDLGGKYRGCVPVCPTRNG
jgi:hypothetical protein